jgi:hypothetical protein
MGGSTSDSDSSRSSSIAPGQQPFLQDLYQQGQNQFQGFQANQGIADSALQGFNQGINAGGGPNPYLNDMTQVFRDQLGQANQASGGQAGLTGGFGGGRQGVAEHLNAQSFQSNVGNFLGQQYQGDQNRFAQQQQSALGQAGNVLALQPQGQQQSALNQYRGTIGGPTILGQGSSSSSSFGVDSGLSGAK